MNRYAFLFVIIAVIAFSFAVSIPGSPFLINGMTQKDISDQFFTAITPAGFTFSIWSVIYLSWLILGFLFAFGKISLPNISKNYFLVSVGLSALWLVPWSFGKIEIAFGVITGIFAMLWLTFFSIKNSKYNYFRAVVELFMGWIHIAFFANFAILLSYLGVTNAGNSLLIGQLIFAMAGFATLYFQAFHRTHIVSLVFLWASFGIYSAQNPSPIIYEIFAFCFAVILVIFFSEITKNKKILGKKN